MAAYLTVTMERSIWSTRTISFRHSKMCSSKSIIWMWRCTPSLRALLMGICWLRGLLVESILTVPKLAYGHVETTRGGYNTALTWQILRDKKAPFICLWSLGGSGRYWQAKNSAIYIDLYDSFDQKTPEQIIQSLDSMLAAWVKEYDPTVHYGPDGKPLDNNTGKLVASQLVNTPNGRLSPTPATETWSH